MGTGRPDRRFLGTLSSIAFFQQVPSSRTFRDQIKLSSRSLRLISVISFAKQPDAARLRLDDRNNFFSEKKTPRSRMRPSSAALRGTEQISMVYLQYQ